jgi:tetratricopeptide (TPR) repeat protein
LDKLFDCEVSEEEKSRGHREIVVLLVSIVVVGVIVLAAHWPALSAKSLSLDDDQYLLENRLVQNPSWNSTRCFLTEVLYPSTVRGYYQPLAMISLMADYALGGRPDNLTPFRITSLALHLANTALIILFLYLLFGEPWAAALVGLLFGVHPLTVEPIPWLSERKTLLAAFIVLWSLIFYVRFCHYRNRKNYFVCIAFFILALMSKPTSTPLPFLMLLLDYWPLNRLSKKVVLEKIPFFILSIAAAIITFISQKNTADVTMPSEYGLMQIPLIVCHNIIFYLYKFIWPVRLSAFYPFPQPFTPQNPMVLAGVIGTVVLLAILPVSLLWTRSLLAGWLFFFLAIFPTLGIIGFHPVIAADRHAYLPMVGFLLPLAALLTCFHRVSIATFSRRHILALVMVLLVSAAEIITLRRYLVHWCDTVTHYEYMLSLTPGYPTLHNNLALAFERLDKTDEAIEHYYRSLQLSDSYEVHNNLGNALLEKGEIDEAIEHFRNAIALTENMRLRKNQMPGFAEAHYNLANALSMQERFDEAVEHYNQALQLTPYDADTHYALGLTLAKMKEFSQAIEHYKKAIELEPNFIFAHGRLGLALAAVGRNDEAIEEFQIVLSDRPEDAEIHFNIGVLLEQQGEIIKAIKHYQQALQINPDFTQAHEHLQAALAKQAENN